MGRGKISHVAVVAAAAAADGHVALAHIQVFSVFEPAFDAPFFAVIDGKTSGRRVHNKKILPYVPRDS